MLTQTRAPNIALKRLAIRWGVHPDAHKQPAADHPIEVLPLPCHVHIPLQQHIGTIASPIVTVGQHVLKGELIAESQGNISAGVHATTSGTVTAIVDLTHPHPSGLASSAITIEADGEDRWIEGTGTDDPFALAPEEVAKRVSAAGIVGMGGATFPAAVKLTLGRRVAVSTLIINGGECEPYLSCDDRLMREHAAEIVDGMRIIRHAIGANDILCGIEDNKPAAIAAMKNAAAAFPEVRIIVVPSRYPMGSEKQLIQTLTGNEVPADGRPADAGVLVHNVGTAYAVHNAVRHGRALVARVVTVNGGAVVKPRNLLVPIGTMVSELFDYCGGFVDEPARIVMGGPMMGNRLPTTQVPIVKGTSGVLALTRPEIAHDKPMPCIRCGSCVTACPQNLLPLEMAAFIRTGELKGAVDWGLKDCIHCGSCAYVCPAHIPLVHYFSYAKGELAAQERTRMKQDATRQLTELRAARLQRDAAERAAAAAKRKAERAKAKAAAAAKEVSA